MNVSQFDGSAAFHGGGFMPPAANPTPEHSFFASKNRDVQTLLPVTLKQISDAIAGENGKSDFSVDGVDVSTVKLVGAVQEFVGRCTDATFTLDDGTGRVECNRWCQEQIDTAEIEGISNGMYVRVHGRLKTFQGKKTIQVFSVRPVDDYNEIASHYIECMYVHFFNSKLLKPQVGVGVTTQPYMTIPPNQVSGQHSLYGQRSIEERVLQVLNQPLYLSRDAGAKAEDIAQQLKVPVKDVIHAASNLAHVGSIYEIDTLHYKSLANG
ncbi:putative replication factor A protein [Rosa chinensis]|uniref:Putative replication factor A protein n=1 Tax=Rosa chinensis TaxID=74649 RepID=A0A2P6QTE5_ROSCH|nr:replication protein A 32 kDa subunit B [Rosa chinensis]PRQ37409.1 putative replication factor A protein [Rosa chinensis]